MATKTDAAPLSAPASRSLDWIGWGMALASITAFSIITPLSKAAFGLGVTPAMQNPVRFSLATLLLGVTLLAAGRARLHLDRRAQLICLVNGIMIGSGSLVYLWGLTRVDSSVAAMLFSLEPLLVLGLLALRGERFTYRHSVRLGLGLTGVYLLIGPGGRVDPAGAALVAGSIGFFALPMALMQWFLHDQDSRAVTFYMVLGMTLVSMVWWLASGAEWHPPSLTGWLVLGVLAVVCTYFSRLALFTAVQRLGSGQVTLLAPVETMLAVAWSVLFLGERMTPGQLAGAALILLSAALAVVRLRRVPWRAPSAEINEM